MSVAVRRGLYGKMAGDTTLTTMLGTPASGFSQSIYFEQAPAEAKYPMVIFSKQSGVAEYTLKSLAFDNEIWMVKGIDKGGSADTADSIAARLDALLTDGALSISGKLQLYLRRMSDLDYSEDHDGTRYIHSGALFRLVTTPT